MFLVEIAQIRPTDDNEAILYKMPSSRKSHFLALEDAISHIKQLIAKEPAPPMTFFKIHGNGSLAYADAFGNPLPLRDWSAFIAALCGAKGWTFDPANLVF